MDQPIIHFAHANGFPAKVYSKLFRQLEENYTVIYKNLYGHDSRFPIDANWMNIGKEMIEFITTTTTESVIGIGHSFGATITLNAAILRPDLFKAIILIEPVLMNGWKESLFARALHVLNITHHFTPAKKTKGRKKQWPDMESAIAYFKSKNLFKNFEEECFDNLIQFGLKKTENGYELVFDVDRELEIFSALPYHFDRYKGKLQQIPGVIVSANETNISLPKRMKRLSKQQGFKWEIVDGSHMFPLEQPDLTVEIIKKYLKDLVV